MLNGGAECQFVKIFCAEGAENELWEDYLNYFTGGRKRLEKRSGWTSWYNYYTRITEPLILQNLEALKAARIPLDIFQIDDGYQAAVGDWLHVNHKFPHGMASLAAEIRQAGYQPGIWLAPFIYERKSRIYREHKDWLLRDKYRKGVITTGR